MKEYLNENTLFATIAMYIKESSALLLVVEGDDDRLALQEHCADDLDLMAGVGGRENVLRAARLASVRGLKGVRFLIDRDYDQYSDVSPVGIDNVWVSTRHDIFLDLMGGDPAVLRRVIGVYTSSARRRRGAAAGPALPEPAVIESRAIAMAAQLAAVRIVNLRRDLGFDFKRFSFFAFESNAVDVRQVAESIIVRSGRSVRDLSDVVVEVADVHEEIVAQDMPPVGDHDLFAAIARVLKSLGISVGEDTLQKAFIVGITCAALKATEWFVEVQKWAARNGRVGFNCEWQTVASGVS